MKVYTELVVWIDYNENDKTYILGYIGSKDVISILSQDCADNIPKVVWDMLHTDMR